MSIYILPYKSTSEGAKLLAKYLEVPLLMPSEVEFSSLPEEAVVINWGGGYFRNRNWRPYWLNNPANIEVAVDKLEAFKAFKSLRVPCPEFTTRQEIAQNWANAGSFVVVRSERGGMMGSGIQLVMASERVPSAPLYTRHVKHNEEYRIHVFKGRVINVGKKFKDGDNANPYIRNWGDWKFANPSRWPDVVAKAGVKAVQSLGLDFGAADVGYHTQTNEAHVFEVNTAPGTGHNTITRYAQAIEDYLG